MKIRLYNSKSDDVFQSFLEQQVKADVQERATPPLKLRVKTFFRYFPRLYPAMHFVVVGSM